MNQTYTVSGMTCQHCVARVQTALSSVAGVSNVNVSLMPPRATVEGEHIDLSALAAALAGTQFTLTDAPVIAPKAIKR
ncbi:Copper-transporting P-type ATPase [Ephemeroptericola cinctiostellae]|uniref:Copper-transporting P-type ATPase n=1 Tax=Ephemeroptericola cinctiostellae TaxID=2268024 RepID=A0A345DEC5_9BURK|nr:cation transporter [Ephemeroptericola cinctiostellae]AXF86713.1 Copper-transporting P-type ATPase [Ephemeroptericola cinctiostellae]